MKTFSSFIKEVAEPLAGDEKKFKAKHVFVKHKELAPPATKDDKVFNASNKTRAGVPSGYNNNKDVAVYEDTATHEAVLDRLKESNEEKINEESLGKHDELAKYAKELDELSTKTTDSYWKKATKQLNDPKLDPKTHNKRVSGVLTALNRDSKKTQTEEVEEVDEAINPDNYTVTTMLSKFKEGGHRPHIVDKEGHTMYLGGTTYKSAEHAKGHAKAYLHGYARGSEFGANRDASEYQRAHTKHIVEDTEVKSKSFLEAIHEAASKPLIQMEEVKTPAAPIVEKVKKETKKHTSFASAIRNTLQS